MGAFTIQYETTVKPKIEEAVKSALETEVKDVAIQALEFGAMHDIYLDFTPCEYFEDTRRYSFMQDDSYKSEVKGNTLTITEEVHPQNLWGGKHANDDLGLIVSTGNPLFHQPFPRPWMDEAIEANIQKLESALSAGMKRQGF